jgi:hypothetical protein
MASPVRYDGFVRDVVAVLCSQCVAKSAKDQ